MGKRLRRRALHVLKEAAAAVGDNVVVIGTSDAGVSVTTSIPTTSSREVEASIKMVEDALKRLRALHRRRCSDEKREEAP